MGENDIINDRSAWADPNAKVGPATPEKVVPSIEQQPTLTTEQPTAQVETTATPTEEKPVEQAPVVTFEEGFKKEFGDSDVKTIKQRLEEWQNLSGKLTELESRPTYKTEQGKQWDEWLSKGIKEETIFKLGKYNQGGVDALKPDEAIKLMQEIQNKDLTADHINADFQSRYVHEDDELLSEDKNKNARLLKEAALIKDGSAAKEFLKDYIGKQFAAPSGVLDAGKQQTEAAIKQSTDFWTSKGAALTKSVKQIVGELPLTIQGEKGAEEIKVPYTYSLADTDLKAIETYAIQAAVANGLPTTEQGVKELQEHVNEFVWGKYGPKITQAAVNDAISHYNKQFVKTIHNPVTTTQSMTSKTAASGREQAWESKLSQQQAR